MILPSLSPAFRRSGAAVLLAGLMAVAAFRARRLLAPPADPFRVVESLELLREPGGVRASDTAGLTRVPVVRAVDGDTLKILWQGREESLRYFGVNTPEKDRPCYDGATARNAVLAGREILLAFDERPRDKYGRILAYAFTPEGISLEASLVSEGWGRAWTRNGRFRDQMADLEKEARRSKAGCLWANADAAEPRKRRRRR